MGIAYDLGQPVTLRQVKIVTDQPGIDVQILAGDTPSASDISAYRVVGQQSGMSSTATIQLQPQGAAQYYVVWITKLVPATSAADMFDASLSEVSFYQ